MHIRFTKMHGTGNDFVVIDALTQAVSITPEIASRLADRHLGIGCDQVLVVEPPGQPEADFKYRIFNADGSEVAQCGNGARCFAKFVRDRQLTGKRHIIAETHAGMLQLDFVNNQSIGAVLGVPKFTPGEIPLLAPGEAPLYTLKLDDGEVKAAALSLGNPHTVIEVADLDTAPVAEIGPRLSSQECFPEGVNVGFMKVISRREIALRVFERGSGETLACGSGACAAAIAGIRQDKLDPEVLVHLRGGDVQVCWAGEGEAVKLIGPATTVFQGRIRL